MANNLQKVRTIKPKRVKKIKTIVKKILGDVPEPPLVRQVARVARKCLMTKLDKKKTVKKLSRLVGKSKARELADTIFKLGKKPQNLVGKVEKKRLKKDRKMKEDLMNMTPHSSRSNKLLKPCFNNQFMQVPKTRKKLKERANAQKRKNGFCSEDSSGDKEEGWEKKFLDSEEDNSWNEEFDLDDRVDKNMKEVLIEMTCQSCRFNKPFRLYLDFEFSQKRKIRKELHECKKRIYQKDKMILFLLDELDKK